MIKSRFVAVKLDSWRPSQWLGGLRGGWVASTCRMDTEIAAPFIVLLVAFISAQERVQRATASSLIRWSDWPILLHSGGGSTTVLRVPNIFLDLDLKNLEKLVIYFFSSRLTQIN